MPCGAVAREERADEGAWSLALDRYRFDLPGNRFRRFLAEFGRCGRGAFPALTLPDVTMGRDLDVKKLFSGSVGALVFMQTSCAACRKELNAFSEMLKKHPALKVVAVSVDSGGGNRVDRYREGYGFTFPFVHDPEFKSPEIFGFSFTPALVLVGKDGKIAQLKGGFRPGDETALESKIAEMVK